MSINFPYRCEVVNEKGCIAVKFELASRAYNPWLCMEGKPKVRWKGEYWRASRLSYHLNVGPIPRSPANSKEGLACHTCDNSWCINYEHIYIGTAKQNAIDNVTRNLQWRINVGIAASKRVLSEETKRKISKALKGRETSDAHRAKLAIAQTGKQHSTETRAKISKTKRDQYAKKKNK